MRRDEAEPRVAAVPVTAVVLVVVGLSGSTRCRGGRRLDPAGAAAEPAGCWRRSRKEASAEPAPELRVEFRIWRRVSLGWIGGVA